VAGANGGGRKRKLSSLTCDLKDNVINKLLDNSKMANVLEQLLNHLEDDDGLIAAQLLKLFQPESMDSKLVARVIISFSCQLYCFESMLNRLRSLAHKIASAPVSNKYL
jgi:hypothetical protein